APATPASYPLSLHDALPIYRVHPHERVELLPLLLALARLLHHTRDGVAAARSVLTHQRQRDVHVVRARQISGRPHERVVLQHVRSEEHTSELQSRENLVCRL